MVILGLGIGLFYKERWINGGQLPFGPSLFMIFITLIGVFSVFTGIILHSISGLFQIKITLFIENSSCLCTKDIYHLCNNYEPYLVKNIYLGMPEMRRSFIFEK
jgi:hypothetical protein